MGILISNTDFTGSYALPSDKYSVDLIDATIDEREKEALLMLLGKGLYNLFVADLVDQVPQSAIYRTIYNELVYEDGHQLLISKGMKDAVLRYVYFYHVREQKYQNTITGTVQKKGTNSMPAKTDTLWLSKTYNFGIDSFNAIQCYIQDNMTDYPDYKGQDFGYVFNF